ncbi:transcriptional regulator [Streptomyces sp. 3MP-14]|uniref:Transcriptional regulator n=1 Tax=Streptomyces mimosae TaxID=2586635 RepID=A0A5N6AAI2_9ACTN|nr:MULTISPECIES: helix-turn-helix domain-containing protein [Streptomyces]KAB8165272.1 transcriptional regulator [Streptomyces mimosae]KAB8175904.1 transcriptional regulator [Streptomyces sp. 3MP-14]
MTHPTVRHRPGLPDDARAATRRPRPDCPVEIALAALRGRWTTLVVRELLAAERPLGYRELSAALPALSDKVLTDRLHRLAAAGVVIRDRRPGWPPTVSYRLTPHGRRLGPVLQALWDWGAEPASPAGGRPG